MYDQVITDLHIHFQNMKAVIFLCISLTVCTQANYVRISRQASDPNSASNSTSVPSTTTPTTTTSTSSDNSTSNVTSTTEQPALTEEQYYDRILQVNIIKHEFNTKRTCNIIIILEMEAYKN